MEGKGKLSKEFQYLHIREKEGFKVHEDVCDGSRLDC